MSALPNARRTLHGFLTDGTILVVNRDMEVCRSPDLSRSRNHGDGIKKVPRDIHPANGNRDRNRHAGRSPHVVTKKPESQTHVALMGRHNMGAVLSIQKANNLIEVFLCLKELGENVQDITRLVLHLSFVAGCV
jgi:hypothetical protein